MQYRPDLDPEYPYIVPYHFIWGRAPFQPFTDITKEIQDIIIWLNKNINYDLEVNFKFPDHIASKETVISDREIRIVHHIHFRHSSDAVLFQLTHTK